MTEKIQVKLRLEPELIEQLKAQAEKERRSTNNMIEVMIVDYLAKCREEEPKD